MTGELAGEQLVPALSPPGTCACNHRTPRPPMASRPGAQGRLWPEHRKRRGSSAVPARGKRYGEQRSWCPFMRSAVSAGRSRGDMSTPQKCPPTRHYLQTTSDNRLIETLGKTVRALAGMEVSQDVALRGPGGLALDPPAAPVAGVWLTHDVPACRGLARGRGSKEARAPASSFWNQACPPRVPLPRPGSGGTSDDGSDDRDRSA